ncbi:MULTISPECIES: DUF4864 domain-containing protein [unclassified Coleofasciculus]|uniref:DUF4864 domain-containing protein n=1 Tax=Cyanophyceae TaxID=3028117 RepID=UPI001F54D79A|nr:MULTISPECIES: DUF4864 domain-containing protein [unclassified Coleofasciculus]
MRCVRCFLKFLLAFLPLTLPVKAQQMEVTDSDRLIIRSVISNQLEAFQKDDAEGAFSFASSEIQAQFGTPDNFLRMVKAAYQPVHRPRSVMFENMTTIEGFPAQQVLLLDREGNLIRALYLMKKQSQGKWKITGCYLVPVKGETV